MRWGFPFPWGIPLRDWMFDEETALLTAIATVVRQVTVGVMLTVGRYSPWGLQETALDLHLTSPC